MWIETSLSLWEEYTLRAFENKMLMRIFGPMRDGMVTGWLKLIKKSLIY